MFWRTKGLLGIFLEICVKKCDFQENYRRVLGDNLPLNPIDENLPGFSEQWPRSTSQKFNLNFSYSAHDMSEVEVHRLLHDLLDNYDTRIRPNFTGKPGFENKFSICEPLHFKTVFSNSEWNSRFRCAILDIVLRRTFLLPALWIYSWWEVCNHIQGYRGWTVKITGYVKFHPTYF